MQRINVIGTTGSGKSTFSRELALALSIPYLEMDSLYWKPQWQEPTNAEFLAKLAPALEQTKWVLDGNYSRTTALKWSKADTVIWINYGFLRTLFQLLKRSIFRAYNKQELWPKTGNVESFRKLGSKDSILLWFFKNYHRNRFRYPKLMNQEQYKNINFVVLKTPKQARAFINNLGQTF